MCLRIIPLFPIIYKATNDHFLSGLTADYSSVIPSDSQFNMQNYGIKDKYETLLSGSSAYADPALNPFSEITG